jgi:hypothetical protein
MALPPQMLVPAVIRIVRLLSIASQRPRSIPIAKTAMISSSVYPNPVAPALTNLSSGIPKPNATIATFSRPALALPVRRYHGFPTASEKTMPAARARAGVASGVNASAVPRIRSAARTTCCEMLGASARAVVRTLALRIV